ncbi:class I mannose-6-phosphate isomerase [Novosphingobium sp. B 225]|uniref:class I mannose-6-phosphate isomerase n=1 Tax=Novosphingobium sp. B 225 TaxID=1961849 RepID=UPI00159563C3|nr:class I mannose-6-phosphate isomerase [Novosphingobium sp. B 225]
MIARLPTRMVERPWGRISLPAPFTAPAGQRIGEVWFEPPAVLDGLLVKYIFTSEALSVQVHPSDAQAPAGQRGKEECWLVLSAEPDARLGIGFDHTVSAEAMRAAALDGSIEQLLAWHSVEPGDFFYIPAGTVHAIGAGITLIEVQQNSDITYRLYDYGRPRELHLDAGIAVARGEAYPQALHQGVPARGSVQLVEGPKFRLDRLDGAPDAQTRARYAGPVLVIPVNGQAVIAGETIAAGQTGVAVSLDKVELTGLNLIAQPC